VDQRVGVPVREEPGVVFPALPSTRTWMTPGRLAGSVDRVVGINLITDAWMTLHHHLQLPLSIRIRRDEDAR
jgi:hypothetical protein